MTRRSGDLPKEGDERLKIQQQRIIKYEKISLSATGTTKSLDELFTEEYQVDPTQMKLFKH